MKDFIRIFLNILIIQLMVLPFYIFVVVAFKYNPMLIVLYGGFCMIYFMFAPKIAQKISDKIGLWKQITVSGY